MSDMLHDLRAIKSELDTLGATDLRAAGGDLDRLEGAAEEIRHAWSGSNLGYQAEVYYENLGYSVRRLL